jgi:hypothetical protein
MSDRKNSNKFLDKRVSDSVACVEAALGGLEGLLTDQTIGDSPDGVNPNSRDVLKQLRGENVDRIRGLFERVNALKAATDMDLDEVRRIRVAQGYKP